MYRAFIFTICFLCGVVGAYAQPDHGPEWGNTYIRLGGPIFREGTTQVFFGENAATNVSIQTFSDPYGYWENTYIVCYTPPGKPGLVDITIITPTGEITVYEDAYTYEPHSLSLPVGGPSLLKLPDLPICSVRINGNEVPFWTDEYSYGSCDMGPSEECSSLKFEQQDKCCGHIPEATFCEVPANVAVPAELVVETETSQRWETTLPEAVEDTAAGVDSYTKVLSTAGGESFFVHLQGFLPYLDMEVYIGDVQIPQACLSAGSYYDEIGLGCRTVPMPAGQFELRVISPDGRSAVRDELMIITDGSYEHCGALAESARSLSKNWDEQLGRYGTRVDYEQFARAFSYTNVYSSNARFSCLDTDKDGFVELSDLSIYTAPVIHHADTSADGQFDLAEILALIQIFNVGGYHDNDESTGIEPGLVGEHTIRHAADVDFDARIELPELLRVIQFWNMGGYTHCPGAGTPDGYCAGA